MASRPIFGGGFDRGEVAPGMHLSEFDIDGMTQIAGESFEYDVDYQDLTAAYEINLKGYPEGPNSSGRYKLVINAMIDSSMKLEDNEDVVPPSRVFEATVLDSEGAFANKDQSVFGVFFPDGYTLLMEFDPNGMAAERHKRASATLVEAGAVTL